MASITRAVEGAHRGNGQADVNAINDMFLGATDQDDAEQADRTSVPNRNGCVVATTPSLPGVIDAHDLCLQKIAEPPELVEGFLHQGSKLSVSGASKAGKTWFLQLLALCVAYGLPFLGHKTRRSRVLLVDMELQQPFCRKRLMALQEALNVKSEPGWLDVLPLRGFAGGHAKLLPRIAEGISNGRYGLGVFDPLYKLYSAGSNENAAADVGALMNSLERLCVTTGAAVAFATHFSKGNQAGKESIDRVSGSGVFARDPDSLLSLTAHQEPDCFTLESTLRNFPPIKPVVLRWRFPLFDRDTTLNPAALKKRGGRPAVHSAQTLLSGLQDGMTSSEWQSASGIRQGATFRKLRDELQQIGRVRKAGQKWESVSNVPNVQN